MVVAVTRDGTADPDEEEQTKDDLENEPEKAPPAAVDCGVVERPRCVEPTEEEGCADGGQRCHVHVFAQVEESEAETRVVGGVTTNQFGFTFRHIERGAVGFCQHSYHVDTEGRSEQNEVVGGEGGVPAEQSQGVGLVLDDTYGGHGAARQDDGHHRKTHRDLVGDHLCGGAQTTQQRVAGG